MFFFKNLNNSFENGLLHKSWELSAFILISGQTFKYAKNCLRLVAQNRTHAELSLTCFACLLSSFGLNNRNESNYTDHEKNTSHDQYETSCHPRLAHIVLTTATFFKGMPRYDIAFLSSPPQPTLPTHTRNPQANKGFHVWASDQYQRQWRAPSKYLRYLYKTIISTFSSKISVTLPSYYYQ